MPTTVSTANELISAVDDAGSGDEIVAQAGTYNFNGEWIINSGGVTIRGASGARPHIVFPGRTSGDGAVKIDADNVTFRGFEVSDSGFKGVYTSQAHGSTVEDVHAHDNWHTGIMNNGSRNVTFRNCDSWNNYGNMQSADGINMTGNSSNMARDNVIEGCRAWNNADDGYDMYASENNTIRNCWSWNNGRGGVGNGNGFKLGRTKPLGGGHLVENCVAWNNAVDNSSYSPGSGFWWNGEDDNTITVRNCTAWGNGIDFRFEDIGHTLENNIAVGNNVTIGDAVNHRANTWNLGIDEPQLRSRDPNSDAFARPASSSPCIGAGVDGGDIGAFPSNGDSNDNEDDSGSNAIPVDGVATLAASAAETTSSALQSEHSGFNGDGYVNFTSNEGASMRWPLEVATAGTYNFRIRYANGGSNDRTATLRIGDSLQDVTFPTTDGWVNWSTLTGTVDLPSGAADLAIETTGQDAGNVDRVTLQPTDDGSSGEDGENRSGDTTNHGYHIPDAGQDQWHVPVNENFAAIDRDVPVVDAEGAKGDYEAIDGTLYIAMDTATVYVGDGSQWNRLGTLS